MLTALALPAFLALIIKSSVLLLERSNRKNHQIKNTLYVVLGVFVLHSIVELLLFWNFAEQSIAANFTLRLYYVCIASICTIIIIYALETARIKQIKFYGWITLAAFAVYCPLVLFTDLIIAGYTNISYAITRIPGQHYWVFQTYTRVAFVSILFILVHGMWIHRKSKQFKLQCKYLLLAFLPFMLSGELIIIAMQMGYKINALAILPFTTILFVVILFYNERKHQLTNLLKHIPGTKEYKVRRKFITIGDGFIDKNGNLKTTMTELEHTLIEHTFDQTDKNVTQTAKELEINRVTLYSKLKKFNITTDSEPEKSEPGSGKATQKS